MNLSWDELYSNKDFGGVWYPDEGVVRFTARYIQQRKGIDSYDVKKDIKNVLDVGCGNGRHVVFFTEQGFDTYGMDISKYAIKIGDAWLAKKGLNANLTVGDAEKLSYDNQFFDVIVSCDVLDHISFSKCRKVMDEIKRVCKIGGYIYITLRSTHDSEFGKGKKAGHNTFVLQEGHEKGMVQHYFDSDEIINLFQGFHVFDIGLNERIVSNLKFSRWYIIAELKEDV